MVKINGYLVSPENWGKILKQKAFETHQKVEKLVEKYFAALSFVFSSLLLLFAAPGALLFGTALGAVVHYLLNPKLRIQTGERKIPILNATIAIVGAMAALVSMTPGGKLGGFVFRAIPFLASTMIGWTCYRIIRSKQSDPLKAKSL